MAQPRAVAEKAGSRTGTRAGASPQQEIHCQPSSAPAPRGGYGGLLVGGGGHESAVLRLRDAEGMREARLHGETRKRMRGVRATSGILGGDGSMRRGRSAPTGFSSAELTRRAELAQRALARAASFRTHHCRGSKLHRSKAFTPEDYRKVLSPEVWENIREYGEKCEKERRAKELLQRKAKEEVEAEGDEGAEEGENEEKGEERHAVCKWANTAQSVAVAGRSEALRAVGGCAGVGKVGPGSPRVHEAHPPCPIPIPARRSRSTCTDGVKHRLVPEPAAALAEGDGTRHDERRKRCGDLKVHTPVVQGKENDSMAKGSPVDIQQLRISSGP